MHSSLNVRSDGLSIYIVIGEVYNRIGKIGCPSEIVDADLNDVGQLSKGVLAFSLCRFVREVKKMDGSDYPPNSVCELVIMIQMYLHEMSVYWHLFDDAEFLSVKNVVDNTMKERHAMGLGVKQSSEIISLSHEDILFGSNTLGESNPLQLLRTVIYVMGLHCVL